MLLLTTRFNFYFFLCACGIVVPSYSEFYTSQEAIACQEAMKQADTKKFGELLDCIFDQLTVAQAALSREPTIDFVLSMNYATNWHAHYGDTLYIMEQFTLLFVHICDESPYGSEFIDLYLKQLTKHKEFIEDHYNFCFDDFFLGRWFGNRHMDSWITKAVGFYDIENLTWYQLRHLRKERLDIVQKLLEHVVANARQRRALSMYLKKFLSQLLVLVQSKEAAQLLQQYGANYESSEAKRFMGKHLEIMSSQEMLRTFTQIHGRENIQKCLHNEETVLEIARNCQDRWYQDIVRHMIDTIEKNPSAVTTLKNPEKLAIAEDISSWQRLIRCCTIQHLFQAYGGPCLWYFAVQHQDVPFIKSLLQCQDARYRPTAIDCAFLLYLTAHFHVTVGAGRSDVEVGTANTKLILDLFVAYAKTFPVTSRSPLMVAVELLLERGYTLMAPEERKAYEWLQFTLGRIKGRNWYSDRSSENYCIRIITFSGMQETRTQMIQVLGTYIEDSMDLYRICGAGYDGLMLQYFPERYKQLSWSQKTCAIQ